MRVRTDERGFAIVVSMMALGIMLSLGLASYAFVVRQTNQSGQERVRESAFNLAEDVLDATVSHLETRWPTSGSQYPSSCTQASTSTSCPSPTGVTGAFTGTGAPIDFSGTTWSWTTEVHDNAAPSTTYYSDSASGTRGQPGYDANGDAAVWVRSQGVVRGRKRTLVALVKVQQIRTNFPQNVITAGWFQTGNNGKKVMVNTAGDPAGAPATLAVRCNVGGQTYPNSCLNYQVTKGQVSPDTKQDNYAGGNALSSADLDLMRQRATALGTYYTGCPTSAAGTMVFIEGPASCSYTGSYNSAGAPGFIIVANGTISFGSSGTYHGLVYAANLQNSTGVVVQINANAQVIGGVAVDGGGGVSVGQSGNNLVYNRNVFSNVIANGFISQIQNSWREIAAS
jgi:Tfp pilus assembly protein PilX